MRSILKHVSAALVLLGVAPAVVHAGSTLQVSAAADTTCAVVSGSAWCWGYNADGQLGNGGTAPSSVPVQVSGLASVSAITTGGSHSCAVAAGAAWCWGKNADGQLGDNSNAQRVAPVPVAGLASGVTAIAAGDDHTCAIVNGGVMCWGANIGYGQLGDGTANASLVPVSVAGLPGVVTALSAGRQHTCAIASGAVHCWGRGDSGELGHGASPVVSRTPVAVTGGSGASFVDGGGSFACGVKDGAAYCWGFNGQGQLGTGDGTGHSLAQPVVGLATGVTAMAAGTSYHACAVQNGGLACWGYNNAGQLGNPAAGGGTMSPIAVIGLASGVFQVAAGGLHTCAVAAGGIYCWGDNALGQLGKGDIAPSNVPVLVIPVSGFHPLFVNPHDVGFTPQSQATTSAPIVVTITNNGASTVTIDSVAVFTAHFAQVNNCGALAPNASCEVAVTFTPGTSGALADTLNLHVPGQNIRVLLRGLGERSLVTHYYGAILNRAPDAAGKAFWDGEFARLASLGVNPNESWFLMANYFFNSAEYLAANKSNAAFMADVYNTFFNRAPDQGGLDFWMGQMNAGLSREGVIFWFMFSNEFRAFTQNIFGTAAARAEVDMVMDLFRGILNRFPETAALNAYVGSLRAAQCQAPAQRAGAVYRAVNDISYFFLFGSSEYASRNRTNQQYVSDMYNAFLRRGGTDAEVDFWIGQLDSGARDRNQLRAAFIDTPEFSARVQAVIDAGCVQ